jgi:hypothetical protein
MKKHAPGVDAINSNQFFLHISRITLTPNVFEEEKEIGFGAKMPTLHDNSSFKHDLTPSNLSRKQIRKKTLFKFPYLNFFC